MTSLEPSYRHLRRLTDDTGVLEHAFGSIPRRRYGYCLDDNARALMVASRAAPESEAPGLAPIYLAFVAHAQAPDGSCHNRLAYDRRWEDVPGLGDWWGRALWGLGVAASHHPDPRLRQDALQCFEISAGCRSPHPRAMAFASLGAAEVLEAHPANRPARALLEAVAERTPRPVADETWPWPEARLTYANAALAEAMLATGRALGDQRLVSDGLLLLAWLLGRQTHQGHFSVTPVGGQAPEDVGPGFDQQPIELAALGDACARALVLTGDPRWAAGVAMAVNWFLGDNDAGIAIYDPMTGGGYDGLTPDGRNNNQGAESTLAAISTLALGTRLGPRLAQDRF